MHWADVVCTDMTEYHSLTRSLWEDALFICSHS